MMTIEYFEEDVDWYTGDCDDELDEKRIQSWYSDR